MHKVGRLPDTRTCPECGDLNYVWNLIDKFSCPSCRHKLGQQPETGKCPSCGEHNRIWNIIDKKNFYHCLNIKIFAYLAISILCTYGSIYALGRDISTLTMPHGGSSGIFVIILLVLNAIFEPLFGENAVSMAFFVFAFVFLSLSYRNFKKKNSGSYDSHSPI